jgi:hypothetical protein
VTLALRVMRFQRVQQYIVLTVARSCCFKALLLARYSFQRWLASVRCQVSSAIWATVALAGMMGWPPGLTGATKGNIGDCTIDSRAECQDEEAMGAIAKI